MIYSIIMALIVLICILLTIVVLLQPGQGQGLSGGLAGGAAGGAGGLGARRAADLLSKSTSVLATALLVLCVLANFFIDRGDTNRSAVQEQGVEAPAQQDDGLNNPSQSPSAVPDMPEEGGSEENDDN